MECGSILIIGLTLVVYTSDNLVRTAEIPGQEKMMDGRVMII